MIKWNFYGKARLGHKSDPELVPASMFVMDATGRSIMKVALERGYTVEMMEAEDDQMEKSPKAL